MKAVILAAGEGHRMRPLTHCRPKVMVPVANKPLLEHLLLEIRQAGIKEFAIVVGYHDEQIRSHFGNGSRWGVSIEYCHQQKQLGTADAVSLAKSLVKDNFLMVNGDILVKHEDITRIARRNETTISVFKTPDTKGLGVIEVSRGKVVHIHEKTETPPSDMINAGLYLFTPDIFEAIAQTPKSPRGEYELTDSLQLMIDQGHTVASQEIKYWLGISYPWDLLAANELLMTNLEPQKFGQLENNVVIKEPVAIGKNTVVRSGTYIVGPVVIGEGCNIGPNCFIRPYTAIGDGCHIGAAVEVKNSIIMKNSNAPHLNYVGDSVIGEDCNLGAGTVIANLRLDGQNIKVGGTDTKRRKLGAIIGDKVETGVNATINVGSVIGNDTFVGPGALVSGIVAPNSRIFQGQR